MSMTGIILAAVVVGGTGLFIGIFLGLAITVVVVDIRDVPDLQQQSQQEMHRLISVRSVEHRLPQRSVRSWV